MSPKANEESSLEEHFTSLDVPTNQVLAFTAARYVGIYGHLVYQLSKIDKGPLIWKSVMCSVRACVRARVCVCMLFSSFFKVV